MVIKERADFARVYVYAMCSQCFRVENIQLRYARYDGHSEFSAAVLNFKAGFRKMNQQWDIIFNGEVGAGLQDFVSAGVGSMGCDSRHHQRMTLPGFDILARIG